jgi:hypothetical protein
MGLNEQISDQTAQMHLVADCAKLIDQQVAAQGGISGLGLKAAYGAVKGIDPSYISGAIQRLLPDALTALDPIWDEGVLAGDPVQHLIENRSRTADRLLSLTDAKVERTNRAMVRGAYGKLRNAAKGYVENAVPGLAEILGTHAQA